MTEKFIRLGSLALLQVVIVGNLQILPASAIYGLSLPFLYLLAVICFFIPCVLMVAELATTRPQTGGAYIWSQDAFGKRMGFFTVCILWISNLLWYPSIFSLIAANVAYLFAPALAQSKNFIMSLSIVMFWVATALNCAGIKISTRLSVWFSTLGIILPMFIIMLCGVYWWLSGEPLAVSSAQTPWIPNIFHLENAGYIIAVVISLVGIELTAVHAGNVINPRRNYPLSLFWSGLILILLLLAAEMAISIIIPASKLSVMTGLLDALVAFFQALHLSHWIVPILFLVLLGNIGSVAAWMLGSTRGMLVALQNNQILKFLQISNKRQAPVGILIFEAVIFTLVSSVFLVFNQISDSFWLLLDLASQITLIYYIILFISAIRLRYLPTKEEGFRIPGGYVGLWFIMGLGGLTSLFALLLGFSTPDNLNAREAFHFHLIMSVGLLITLIVPVFLLKAKQSQK